MTGIVLLGMEAAGKFPFLDYGQLLYLFICVVVHTSVPYRPVAFLVVEALCQVLLEC